MKKRICGFLLCFLILTAMFPLAFAQGGIRFFFDAPVGSAQQGELFDVTMSLSAESSQNVAAYRVKVAFDESRFSFKELLAEGELQSGEFKTSVSGGTLTILYITQGNGLTVRSGEKTPMVTLSFRVLAAAPLGKSEITAKADGVSDNDINELTVLENASLAVSVVPPQRQDCTLKALKPNVGNLQPVFSPAVSSYKMTVPYETTRLEFEATPTEPTATVRVNRKTLNKAGETTLFQITVKSYDNKEKLIYSVQVTRLLKGQTSATASSGKKPSGGKNSSKGDKEESATGSSQNQGVNSGIGQSAVNVEQREIQLEQNRLPAFLCGFLLCVVCAALIVLLYRAKGRRNRRKYEK